MKLNERPVLSARRECKNCGYPFLIPINKDGKISRAGYCGDKCRNEWRAWSMTQLHRRVRMEEPERYSKWITRDWKALSQAGIQTGLTMRERALKRHHGTSRKRNHPK